MFSTSWVLSWWLWWCPPWLLRAHHSLCFEFVSCLPISIISGILVCPFPANLLNCLWFSFSGMGESLGIPRCNESVLRCSSDISNIDYSSLGLLGYVFLSVWFLFKCRIDHRGYYVKGDEIKKAVLFQYSFFSWLVRLYIDNVRQQNGHNP